MKKFSVKIRISVWLTLLTGLLAGLLLVFMLSISRVVADQTAISQLIRIVRSNLAQTSISNGRLDLGSDFVFYQNGMKGIWCWICGFLWDGRAAYG